MRTMNLLTLLGLQFYFTLELEQTLAETDTTLKPNKKSYDVLSP